MAYTLESLTIILQELLNHDEEFRYFNHVKPQLKSLQKTVTSLKQILETCVLESGPKMERIESQIQDAAHEAEDIIEAHMMDDRRFRIYPPDLEQVIQQLHSVMGFLMKIIDGNPISTSTASPAASAAAAPRSKSVVVGVEKDMEQLKDRLTGMNSNLEIIPIVGMGGIGKTTLARNLYQDPSIVSHFQYARAWATISQDYNMRAILLDLLRCVIGKEVDQHVEKKDSELKDILYRSLYGRRYLIVLDDIWSYKFWDEMRKYFPDNNKGSRIVITTRESDVAKHADSQSLLHQVQLLSESVSWHLLHQIVFGEEENYPDLLQEIGEKIARDCGGLPLAINVVGGLLSKVERSQDVWEGIASDVRAAIADSDKQFSNILSLSYNHLPYHLKPCFLYMAAFPEDCNIRTSRLTSLWVAEGFVKANGNNRSLEEEAESYLTALVQRNLLLVRGAESNWKTKSYGIHDLMRDLCIRKAEETNFLHRAIDPEGPFHSPRRLSASSPLVGVGDNLAMSLTRSLICHDRDSFEALSRSFPVSRLVKVLDMWTDRVYGHFPTEILQLVYLRYLCLCCDSELPLREISQELRNLQTLIVVTSDYLSRGGLFEYESPHTIDSQIVEIPVEVWEMPQLRCIKFCSGVIRYNGYRRLTSVREKMQTISNIQLHKLQQCHFFTTFPNMRSLKLNSYSLHRDRAVHLEHMHKLEKLRCSSFRPLSNQFLSSLRLPSSLRKLTLNQCAVPVEFMASLCRLPNLQILRIGNCDFTNEDETTAQEWEVGDGDEFRSLQFLHLENSNLVRWTADETSFPRLRHMLLKFCYDLLEIPGGIGEITTMELIEVIGCSDSVVESARRIVEEQQSEYDNYDLQIRISSS